MLCGNLRVKRSSQQPLRPVPIVTNMALNLTKLNGMTKDQLKNYLYEEFHEHAYARWSKMEIIQRLLELQNG